MDGKYIYNQAFGVIDYCNDITKSRDYSEYFSPNNIRRLIISPDIVQAQFHMSVPDVGKSKTIRIPAGMLNQLENLEDYIPIVQIISTERICSSIEEIVFVTFSNDERVQLGVKEYAFESLIRNFNNKSGDLLETIKKRYVRLHDIILFRGNFNQYKQLEQANKMKKLILISEWDGIREHSEIQFIHTEADWYTKWGSPAAAKTYPRMDGTDGHLYKHFAKYIAYLKKQDEASGLEAFKKERYGAMAEDFKKEFDRFSKLVKMSAKLQKYIDKYGFTANMSYNWKAYTKPQLYKCDLLGDYPKQVDMENGNEGDLYKKNKELTHAAIRDVVHNLSENFINVLGTMYSHYPDTCKVLLKDRSVALVVPNNLSFDVENLERTLGCSLRDSSPRDSAINVCWFTSVLMLNKSAEDFSNEITTREYWEGLLK